MNRQDNAVRLCGRIVNRYDRGNVTTITLSVIETVKGEQRINYPRVYFFREDNTGADKFFLHDEVCITALHDTKKIPQYWRGIYLPGISWRQHYSTKRECAELLNMDGMEEDP